MKPGHTAVAPPSDAPDDYLLVGGGLQNALIALAVLERQPGAHLTLIEREERLGGNHTWCFHRLDVPSAAERWLEPLVVQRWPAYDVRFPTYQRRLHSPYAAIDSDRLHQVLADRLARAPNARWLRGDARELTANAVTLADGQRFTGQLVVDARGPERYEPGWSGYQKFLGLELSIEPGSGPELPLLMDARVPQLDGFRFLYVLPWAPDRVLVEDTYYADGPELPAAALRERVLEHARQSGMRVREVLREERGVLPIPLCLEQSRLEQSRLEQSSRSGPLVAGYAGGLFHPTTGYSLPVAVRLAQLLAEHPVSAARDVVVGWLASRRRQVAFCLRLNRLLFSAFEPAQRFRVLERFYRLPEATVARFYALEPSLLDRARILGGRPPAGFSLARLLRSSGPRPSSGAHPA